MDSSGAMVNEETTKKGPNMFINQVSIGTGEIDISNHNPNYAKLYGPR